jgi:HPt (histidine-containing phosphotransfer) domain-containing protein
MLLEKWIPRQKQVKASTQSKADTQAAIASIEGLNTKKGIRLTGGSSKGYIETLHLFVHDGNERIPQIKACLKNEELLLYTTHTHALKAAAATIGADALSELASALEQAGEQQDLAYMREHTDHFLSELEALINRIKQILSAGETTADLDMEVFKTELIRLKTALSDFDTDTIDDATRCLQPFVRAGGMSATVGEVLQLLLMGSYEEAASRIDTLLKEGSHGANP